MTRLYDPCVGKILLDHHDISQLSVRGLRRCIGVVDQDPHLLTYSILENIGLGIVGTIEDRCKQHPVGSTLSRLARAMRSGRNVESILNEESPSTQLLFDRIQKAAVFADAHSFIEALQNGYATIVEPAKGTLSGGQKQRLALARALVRDPPILLLDEATSALDSASEQRILASLKEARKGKTTITIAHRLGTIRDADHIIVMQSGRVMEEGTHEQLLAQRQVYSAMAAAQSLQVPSLVSTRPSEVSTTASLRPNKVDRSQTLIQRWSFRLSRRSSQAGQLSRQVASSAGPYAMIRGYASVARPHLLMLAIGLGGTIIAGGVYSGDAVIFGTTIGQLDPCRGSSTVTSAGNLAGLLFFTLALLALLANGLGGSAFGRIAEKIVFRVRILAFRSLCQKDLIWHTSKGRTPAMLLSYFTSDTSAVAGLSGVVVGTILTTFVNLTASIIMTHIIAWKIAVVLLATIPILLGSGFMRLYAMARFQKRHQKLYTRSADISLEAIESIKTIANYSLEREIFERYRRSLRAPYKASLHEFAYTNFWLATAYSISILIYSLAYWWGSKQIVAGTYSQTQFFIVVPALLFSAQSCGQMFALAPDVSNARAAAKRLYELIQSEPETMSSSHFGFEGEMAESRHLESDPEKGPKSPENGPPSDNLPGMAVQMTNVCFAYPNRPGTPILDALSLSILPGQFCALVGPSGSGKSTILSLLEAFYSPTSGCIILDDRSISDATSISHRSSTSFVPQTSTLFSDTINWNVSLGAHPSQTPSDDEIVQACKLANIDSVITFLPHGYQTQCGANASHFSGGEKQRLCIARALVRKPRLLLMDEPTSALDSEAETKLQETIEGLRSRMTIIIVAHRLCTVQRADRIFWIEGGRCTHSGTHTELLMSCPGYGESAAHQTVG